MKYLIIILMFLGCGSSESVNHCETRDLSHGISFILTPSFLNWINPHGTTDMWQKAVIIAPLLYSGLPDSNAIKWYINMATDDPRNGVSSFCNTGQYQFYTYPGDSTSYACEFLQDTLDLNAPDPYLVINSSQGRARLLAHEAGHGLACKTDHLPASQSGIMCGAPFAPYETCSIGLHRFTQDTDNHADKDYLCSRGYVINGICSRVLPPLN